MAKNKDKTPNKCLVLLHILLILNCFSHETESTENILKEQTGRADRNVLRAARALKSQAAFLHKVLLLFDHFSCAMTPKADGLPRAQWAEKPDSNILGTQSRKKILSAINAPCSEHNLINGQSSQKDLVECCFIGTTSRNWQKTKLNI